MQQQPPELNPDPLAGLVAELSKRLDSIERRLDGIERRLDRVEAHQREDIAALRQDMRQDIAALRQDMRQDIAALRQEHRRDFRWVIGIQLTTLIALGTLILTRLPG